MDNVEVPNVDELSIGDPIPQKIDVIQLSPEDKKEVARLESQAIIGSKEFIHNTIVTKYPLSYELGKAIIDPNTDSNPGWGFYFSNHDKIEFVVVANTDLIKHNRLIPPLLRHEAIEGIMQGKDLDLDDTAHQIGVDPDVINYDPDNGIAHYVALYHELKMAYDTGVLEEQIEFRRKIVGSVVKDVFIPMVKQSEDGSQNTDWKRTFKDSAGQYARLNFLVPRQMAERIRSDSK